MRDTEVAITDGAWRIVYHSYIPGDQRRYLYIQHDCPKGINCNFNWLNHTYYVNNRSMSCGWCNQSPPEGLQVAFWFLKVD